jgi:hypothetical protein
LVKADKSFRWSLSQPNQSKGKTRFCFPVPSGLGLSGIKQETRSKKKKTRSKRKETGSMKIIPSYYLVSCFLPLLSSKNPTV